ncbi:MAG: hypothetical protein RBS73_02370 [Prolixibacteraceae bacterium]|jgi:hypothetical protein|nr:hypothetical protein [Prolixibacteraceae bacterium]
MLKSRTVYTTVILSVALLYLFFAPILHNPNQIYFAPGGDGLKAYYGALYHLKYDSDAFRMNGMNYPYGENIFFTDNQPMVVNTIKFISNHFFDISGYTVAIINLLMLFSFLLAAVFLCLIFTELGVSWWFAMLASVGITFLSPQIGRLGGHFTLSYALWLPLMIWLLIRFDRNKSLLLSALIGFVTFLAAGMHMYFFALFGFLFLFYWGRVLLAKQMQVKDYRWLLHVFIQMILPFLVIQLLVNLTDPVNDRTTHPWGFFTYRANPATVFLPLHKSYAEFLSSVKAFQNFDWEAYAFIGMVALVGMVWGIGQMVKRVRNRQKWHMVTDQPLINLLFWASVVSLLVSFSFPFNLGLEFLLDYLGPVQQLRAVSRFAWVFYYMLNIVVFYGLFLIFRGNKWMKILAVSAFIFVFYDAWLNVGLYRGRMVNRIPELEDSQNLSAENEWTKTINASGYQAILPLPYFHVGSENVWLDPKCDIARQSYIVSLKTGLPSMAVMLSRTSISQTYKSLELVSDPVAPYRILDELPNHKPLLLVVDRCTELSHNEKRLISLSEKIWEGTKFSLHCLSLGALHNLAAEGQKQFEEEMKLVHAAQLDSAGCIAYESFDKIIYKEPLYGKGAVWGSARFRRSLFDNNLSGVKAGDQCEILFWVHHFEKDLMGRTVFEFVQKNGDQVTNYQLGQFQHFFCSFRGNWMRIRIPFEVRSENEKISLSVRNKELKRYPLVMDELIVRKRSGL